MATWLENISVLELSAVARPANRKRKLFQKAQWSTAFINDLPDSSFLHIAPGGEKDDEGKTTPRSLRYFPVRDGDGKVDLPHLRNALSRIPQAKLPGDVKVAAAAKARRLLEQITKSMEDHTMPPLWIPDETAEEYLAKAQMPDLQKQALKAALAALKSAKADMDADQFKSARAALAKLLGYGKTAKAIDDATEAAQKAAAEDKAKMVEVIKSTMAALEAEEPSINDALAKLGELAGVTPTFKAVAQLPPELKAQWEAMQKSQQTDREQLAELKKSLADREAKATEREWLSKAEGMAKVPLATDALGRLMHVVSKTEDSEAIASLEQLLKSVQEMVAKSELFRERGGTGQLPPDRGGVFGKIDALAQQLVEKSERPLTIEQARTRILERHPELFDQYQAQQG